MGSQGDNPQKILTVGDHEWLRVRVHWSPDGHRLAYIRVHPLNSERLQTSLETCDLRGANRTAVVPDMEASDFRWLSDGRIVYARSDSGYPGENVSGGDDNLWEIGIDNHAGTPTGKPKRISQWAGTVLGNMSVSADGKRLVLLKATFQWQTFLGELAAGGTRLKLAHRLTNTEAEERPTGVDGRQQNVIAHIKPRHMGYLQARNQPREI